VEERAQEASLGLSAHLRDPVCRARACFSRGGDASLAACTGVDRPEGAQPDSSLLMSVHRPRRVRS